MNPEEYTKLNHLEKEHWFYAGKREIVRSWIARLHPLDRESLLLDCGAGTGQFAAEMQDTCRVLAIDDHDESLVLATAKLGPSAVARGSCLNLPVESASVDCVTALDVLEHVEDDAGAMTEFARVLKPGGIAVITVPALDLLWSDWDVSLHHFRRYNRAKLLQLLGNPDFSTEHWNFINVLALPAVYASRKLRAITGNVAERAEDVVPAPWLNRILRETFVRPACQSAVRFPFGVGLLGIVRRRID